MSDDFLVLGFISFLGRAVRLLTFMAFVVMKLYFKIFP